MNLVGDKAKLKLFIKNLAINFKLIAPVSRDGILTISQINVNDFEEIDWSGVLPEKSWKSYILPATEKIIEHSEEKIKEFLTNKIEKRALIAMNVIDLKALSLFDLVFSNDIYYQNNRRQLLIIGYGANWPNEYKKLKPFSYNYEEDILEHVPFDVFIAQIRGGIYKFYSGSKKGQVILESSIIKNFDHVEFAGPIPEEGPDKRMMLLMEKVEKSAGKNFWKELGKKCIACGKCSIACPTCYCFDLIDKSDPNCQSRERRWSNCFYNDFSKVAGGHKELDTVGKKIFFWYVHKFVRVPFSYKIPGCVSCGRCTKVCPVGIDIAKNIATIMKFK